MSNQPQNNPAQRQIQIRDTLPGGEYANMMGVQHTKEEFMLTFVNVMGGSGRVVGKIISSPGHLKRIINALSDNMKKYENQFGQVKEAQLPEKNEVGFRTE